MSSLLPSRVLPRSILHHSRASRCSWRHDGSKKSLTGEPWVPNFLGSSSSSSHNISSKRLYSYSIPKHVERQESFSSYQYPLAKEAPEVSRTQASEVLEADHAKPSEKQNGPATQENRFDRSGLSSFEIEQIRTQQRNLLSTKLSGNITSADSVHPSVPLPTAPARSSAELLSSGPDTRLSQLDNGIRVVSQEANGMASTVGVVSNLGSRHEIHPRQRGATNLLELLAFGTPTPQFPDPSSFLTDLGGAAHFCTTGREQSLHVVDLLRPHVGDAFRLLQQVLLEPQWSEEHIQHAKQTLGFQAEDAPPEIILGEAMQLAAFGKDQQLGQPHCYFEENEELTAAVLSEFWQSQFVNKPNGLVFSGVGIDHDQLMELVATNFGHLKQVEKNTGSVEAIPSIYHGGQVRLERKTEDNFVRIGLGLKVGGWHSNKDLVTICVLQTLLGGGSSFSAGGPGKGMYSRLYRQVLNRFNWAESAESFGAFFDEVGVFGLAGSTVSNKVQQMVQVFAEHLTKLSKEKVTEEELDRARNMLRGNVLTQLESRLVLFEDLGRQVLTYGHRENVQITCEKIQSVTAEDILDVVQRAIEAAPPTVAAVGPGATLLPKHEEICDWFSKK